MRRTATLSAARALLALHLVLQPLVFSVFSHEAFEFPKAMLARLTAIGLLALAVVAGFDAGWGRGRQRLAEGLAAARREPLVLAAGALLLAAALSAATGLSPRTSLHGGPDTSAGLLTAASGTVLFAGFRLCGRDLGAIRLWLWAVLTAQAGTIAYALVQAAGLDPLPWRGESVYRAYLRVASTLGNTNFLGAYLSMGLPTSLWLALDRARAGRRAASAVAAGVSLLAVAVIVATLSRGAWAALLGGSALLAAGWWWTGERAASRGLIAGALVSVLLAGAISIAGGGDVFERAAERIAATAERREPRIDPWRAALSMFRTNPLTGVGLDAFQLAYPAHQPADARGTGLERIPARAHATPLHTAATQGLVGLAALAGLLVAAALSLRLAPRAPGPAQRTLTVALAAGLAACAVRSLVGFTVAPVASLLALQLGVLAALAAPGAPRVDEVVGPGPRWPRWLLAGGGLLAAGCLAVNAAAAAPGAAGRIALAASAVLAATALVARWAPAAPAPGSAERGPAWLAVGAGAAALAAALALVVLPMRADSRCRLGRDVARDLGPRQAIPILEEALAWAPGNDLCWHALGAAHQRAAFDGAGPAQQRAHIAAARDAYQRAVLLVPANALHHGNLARLLGDGARVARDEVSSADAYRAFEAAFARSPASPRMLDDAGRAALRMGDTEAARAYAIRALRLRAGHPPALQLRGLVALQRGEARAAERYLRRASEGDWRGDRASQAASYANLALAREMLGEPEAALAAVERALALDPALHSAARIRARLRAASGAR